MVLQKVLGQTSFLRLSYHRILGFVAALRYGFPGSKLRLIGITGTDGKTSTCYFTAHILEKSGLRVGLATTVGFQIGDKKWKNLTHKTTLGRFGLQRLLREMVDAGVDVGVIEVSSHGLVQSRLTGVRFETAVITNLSREHLDYHGTMDAYRDAKGLLFRKLRPHGTSIVYANFPEATYYASLPAGKLMTYGVGAQKFPGEYLQIESIQATTLGYDAQSLWQGQQYVSHVPLLGEFNVYNAHAAVLAANSVGVDFSQAIQHVATLTTVPGRMEPMVTPQGVRVIIDYAVTPMALTSMYTSCTALPGRGRLLAVLGACGDRDQGKRPEMGRIATTHCDMVFFTNEEPYTEDPESIIAMLVSGAVGENYKVILDRKAAIAEVLACARPNDIIVISGMGDQSSMIVGGEKLPWSDREVVQELMLG